MRIGYGISVAGSNQRNFVSAQAEQVIWKIAFFGAGTPSSNGEYVWDGIETQYSQPVYKKGISYISWNPGLEVVGAWTLYDVDADETTYISLGLNNLTSWQVANGLPDAPSSALSYAQDSFISSLTLAGAGTTSSNGTYARSSDGTETPFISGSNQIFYDAGRWVVEDNVFADFVYESDGTIFNWTVFNGDSPAPTVSAIVYSA